MDTNTETFPKSVVEEVFGVKYWKTCLSIGENEQVILLLQQTIKGVTTYASSLGK